MWASTVIAELATRGFPRDTWVPGASLCSSRWLCCVGFSCLFFPNLMLVSANHSVGHHSPSHRDGKPKGGCWSAFINCIARPDNTKECPSVSLIFFSPSVWRKKCWWSRSGMVSSPVLCKETKNCSRSCSSLFLSCFPFGRCSPLCWLTKNVSGLFCLQLLMLLNWQSGWFLGKSSWKCEFYFEIS